MNINSKLLESQPKGVYKENIEHLEHLFRLYRSTVYVR